MIQKKISVSDWKTPKEQIGMSCVIARFGFLLLFIFVSGAFTPIGAQTIPPEFPKGVKRTWISFPGGAREYTITRVVRNSDVTVSSDPEGRSQRTTQWAMLHPYDRGWLESVYLWMDQQRPGTGNQPAGAFVAPPVNPPRLNIGNPVLSARYGQNGNRKFLIASFLWWWHELGYLQIEEGKDAEEQMEFLIEMLDETFKEDAGFGIYDFAAFQVSLKGCFDRIYSGLGGFSVLEHSFVAPEILHHHVQGADLALLGVFVVNGNDEWVDRIALLEVSDTGKIEFIHRGNRVVGQLELVDPQQDRRRKLGSIAWQIRILNESALPDEYRKGETEIYLDPEKRLSLWLVRPGKYAAKEFAIHPVPPIPAPDMSIHLPKTDPQIAPTTPTAFKRNPAFFVSRHHLSGLTAPRFQLQMKRMWTDANGRSIEARFVGFERPNPLEPSGIKIDPGAGPVFLKLEQLGAADLAFVRFLAVDQATQFQWEMGVRAGRLTYHLTPAEGPGYEVKINFGNNQCIATVQEIETSGGSEEKGLVEKARELVLGPDVYTLAVDYERFAYKTSVGNGTKKLLPEDLNSKLYAPRPGDGKPDNLLSWINRAAPVEHMGLPCRAMVDLQKIGFAAPGYTGAGKVAIFPAHGATFVWKLLCADPAVPGSSLLRAFQPFAESWYAGSLIPMEIRMVHSLNSDLSVRLQLVDYDFTVPAPEVEGLE